MLGTVFLRMGDLPEAGKFLFLSGVRKPEYEESIDLFLSKYGKHKSKDFLRLLPRKARLNNLSDYPDEVARKLREMGFPKKFGSTKKHNARDAPQSNGTFFWITCVTIALITLVLLSLGATKALELIRHVGK